MTTYAIRFTSKDADVAKWMESQDVKSKSIELAIKMLIRKYGTGDIYSAAVEQMLNQGLFDEPVPLKTEKIQETNVSVKADSPTVKQKPNATIDPQALLAASEQKMVRPQQQQMSSDDILAMMSNQAGSI